MQVAVKLERSRRSAFPPTAGRLLDDGRRRLRRAERVRDLPEEVLGKSRVIDPELLRQLAEVNPQPPRQIRPSVPQELERICLKAMARKAEERYGTASDLAEELRRFLATAASLAPASTDSHQAKDTFKSDSGRSSRSSVAKAPERRQLTVLFCGLRSLSHDSEVDSDEDFDFEEALRAIHIDLNGLNEEAAELAARIARNFEELGA